MTNVGLSVVSHRQADLVASFLSDIARLASDVSVVLTCNVPDQPVLASPALTSLRRIENANPQGFGANHNAAFTFCEAPSFCVANPDIRLVNDPFPKLMECMEDPSVGVVAPLVLAPSGEVEDSARYFPTPARLMAKAFGFGDGRFPASGGVPIQVDWVAGMFMFFRAEAFQDIGGFDEKFFLYYEDVDICTRLWKAGWKVMLHPGVSVIHGAQRASRRHPRYMAWHLSSMARYFSKHWGRVPRIRTDA